MTQNEIETSCCLDYIRFTAGRENEIDELLPRGIPSLSRTGEILNYGSYGYDRTMPLEGGGRIMYHTEDQGMKYCVELSGTPLNEVRRDGFEDADVIYNCFSGRVARAAFTRIDVAFDIKNSGGSIAELYQSWNDKETTALAKTAMWVESVRSEYKANTLYFGVRESSPRFIRAYDKAAQQKLMGISWLRLEAEIKKRRCMPFAWSVTKESVVSAGRSEIKGALKTPVAWVVAAMEGELAPPVIVPRSEGSPNEYIRAMVIPFIKNHHGQLTDETKKLLLLAVEDYISVT